MPEEKTESEEMRDLIESAIEEDNSNEEENPGVQNDTQNNESENNNEGSASAADPSGEQPSGEGTGETAQSGAQESEQLNVPHETKAPQSWSPADREEWSKLPPNIQAQVTKREQEITTMLAQSGEARKQMESFNQMIQPYQSVFAAQGVHPIEGINNVMQLTASLQGGTPAQKAQTAANIIRHFGVDIPELDRILVGKQSEIQQSPEIVEMQNEMGQMRSYIQNQDYQRQQEAQAQIGIIDNEVREFTEKNEFAADLRMDMADMIDFAEKRGQTITLQEAYDRALKIRPDIQGIITNRNQSSNNASSLDKARQASVSVAQNGAPDSGPGAPTDLRGAILQAMEG